MMTMREYIGLATMFSVVLGCLTVASGAEGWEQLALVLMGAVGFTMATISRVK